MSYSKRIMIAAAFSLLLHVAGMATWYALSQRTPRIAVAPPAPEPIELDLQPAPQEQPEPVQLVDVAEPAPEPVPPSPLIAEDHSEAMDTAPRESERPSPVLPPDDFDQLAAAPVPAVKPESATPPREPPRENDREAEDATDEDTPEETNELREMENDLEPVLPPESAAAEEEPAEDGPIKLAQVQPPRPQRPAPGMSRSQSGTAREGATNFQAIRSEIAPYLKQVRARVEREWNEMLYTRYSGTSPVKAVIDCAISPSGELVSVSVVGTQNDRLYSALCQDAVQRAGPFGPFPFEVPDIYREKNLEIRWTFSFL